MFIGPCTSCDKVMVDRSTVEKGAHAKQKNINENAGGEINTN